MSARTLSRAASSAVALEPGSYETSRARLQDRVVLVSGGDGPIGRAIVLALLSEGANVTVTRPDVVSDDWDPDSTAERAYTGRLMRLCGDVGHMGFCREAVAQTVAAFGRLDSLVNNAAEPGRIDEPSLDLERTFLTNVFACFDMTKVAAPHLGVGATIVNTTLVAGYRGSVNVGDYTRSWASTLGRRGVRVNAVVAGPLSPSAGEAGEPCVLAERCVFLASEDSAPLTGKVLEIGGGPSLGSRPPRVRAARERAQTAR